MFASLIGSSRTARPSAVTRSAIPTLPGSRQLLPYQRDRRLGVIVEQTRDLLRRRHARVRFPPRHPIGEVEHLLREFVTRGLVDIALLSSRPL